MVITAIMIDGGFYCKRARYLWGDKTPKERASELMRYCQAHLAMDNPAPFLYRIFYYDCPPSGKKVYHPYRKEDVDLSQTALSTWMSGFHKELMTKRKVAVRFGRLSNIDHPYNIKPDIVKKLCDGSLSLSDLRDEHFYLEIQQKGVDMKLGLDIASIAYKRQVNQIVLISGDSDFVPAAKLARREGIDFILDPMHSHISSDLIEHIDGKRSPQMEAPEGKRKPAK